MRTAAGDVARPCPIAWRLQGFGDARAQVLQASGAQALHRRPVPARRRPGQTPDGGYECGVRPVGLGPGQDMVRRPVSQHRVDLFQGSQEIDDESGFHGKPWSPGLGFWCVCRVARQGFDQRGGGAAEIRRAGSDPGGDATGQQVATRA